MSPRVDDVMRLCCDISAHEQIKVAVKGSAKGALMAGGSAFVGGLVGGPPGIAVGGVLGSLLAGWLSSGHFRPLTQILAELPPAQRDKLYEDVSAVLAGLNWTDAAQLVALVTGNATLQQQVLAALLNYVTKELRAEVRYRD
ncbi:protein C19orf12 homolog [Vanacampus margaritifer]